MTSNSDDRSPRAHRFEAGLPAIARVEDGDIPCTVRNFSRTGVLLEADRPWPRDVGKLELILQSAAGDLEVPVEVRVVRVEGRGEDGPLLAVRFQDQDPRKAEEIEILLQRVIEGHALAPELPEVPPGMSPQETRKILDSVPLSHRVTLAARGLPRDREILLQDHSPPVLEALARNPNLLPHEARALASQRNMHAPALTTLVSNPRWSRDDEVKAAVIAHANVPVPLARKLIDGMKPPALREALSKPGLKGEVRALIIRRLARPGA